MITTNTTNTKLTVSTGSSERPSEIRDALSLAFAALFTGARTIPLGDNGSLLHELALRSAKPSASPQGTRTAAQPTV
jgi:hypothetical protein